MKEKNKKFNKTKKEDVEKESTNVVEVKPYEQVKMKMFKFPDLFKGLSMKERQKIIRDIGAKAQKEFKKLYPDIKKWFDEYDPIYILSFCAVYFLSSPEGIDREAIDGKLDFYHHDLEILQAFALMHERKFSPKPLLRKAEELRKDMRRINEAMKFSEFNLPNNLSRKELMKRFVLSIIRGQTIAVRNWAYPEQIIKITKQLFSKLSKDIEGEYGFKPEKMIDVLVKMSDAVEERLNTHLNKVRGFYKEKDYKKMYEKYCAAFPNIKREEGDIKKLYNFFKGDSDQVRWSLMVHSDLRLSDIFTFTIEEIADFYQDKSKKKELKEVFNLWSYEFGDLKNHNAEHFLLDNPVLRKPFIRLGEESYFWSTIGIIGHLILGLMEGLIIDKKKIREKYFEKVKSVYFERETEKLFRQNFPTAEIARNVIYGKKIKKYENDLLVVIDNFVLAIECRAGLVTPPARRGAEKRVVKTLEELVVKPTKQANRFIKFLSKNKKLHEFRTKNGKTIKIDSTNIDYYVPLNVTFENLGTVGSNIKNAIKAGLIKKPPNPLAPSISYADLESIFELLENEIEYIHYFIRRSEIEKNFSYEGDELDLLGYYLDNAFNIGDAEYDKKFHLDMCMKSKELDPYFVARSRGKIIDKPKLEMTTWWKDIINKLVERKPERWLEMGFILLNVPKNDQEKFERKLTRLKKMIRKGSVKHKHNWIFLKTIPKQRSYYVVGLPYTTRNREEKNNLIRFILTEERTRNKDSRAGICIAVFYKHSEYPYGTIAYMPKNILE